MLTMLFGGSASGKSSYAEALCCAHGGRKFYIAAMMPYGDEGARRIQRHRELRAGKGFETIERYTDLSGLMLPARGTALIECLCNLTANEMFDESGAAKDCIEAVIEGVRQIEGQCEHLYVVTNDIASDGHIYDDATMAYIRALGEINRQLAQRADSVIEVCCGIPISIKGEIE